MRETLRYMGRSPNEQVTNAVAREICERQGIKAMLAGSISSLGRNYAIALEARNCRTGESLAQQQVEIQGKEQVLRGLDNAASKLRAQLGESLSSIEKFDAPIEQATTTSLQALQAYSLAQQQRLRGAEENEAIPFLKRALELDPKFAIAYATLGAVFDNTGHHDLAAEYFKKAYELRDHVSEREKLYILAGYAARARDLEKAIESYELWKSIYPRDVKPYVNLSSFYNSVGQYEKAATNALEAIRLRPDYSFAYGHLADAYLRLNQWQQVKAICEKAIAQKLEGEAVRWPLYYVGFIENDAAAMQRQVDWARSERNESRNLFHEAMGAAYFGQLQRSRELFRQAIAMAAAEHGKEITLVLSIEQALVEAQFGFLQRARDLVARARPIPQPEKPMAAVTLALTGDATGAQALVDELEKRWPQGTQVKRLLAPTVAAAIELHRKNPSHAILLLQATAPFELAELGGYAGLSPIHLRGQAYLQMGAGKQATTEFQKIVDHRGVALFSPYHGLARLGLAHGYALQGDVANARKSYEEFFTLWKDADPDIPILKQAKAEYAKLQ